MCALAPGLVSQASTEVPRPLGPRADALATLAIMVIGLVLVAGGSAPSANANSPSAESAAYSGITGTTRSPPVISFGLPIFSRLRIVGEMSRRLPSGRRLIVPVGASVTRMNGTGLVV